MTKSFDEDYHRRGQGGRGSDAAKDKGKESHRAISPTIRHTHPLRALPERLRIPSCSVRFHQDVQGERERGFVASEIR